NLPSPCHHSIPLSLLTEALPARHTLTLPRPTSPPTVPSVGLWRRNRRPDQAWSLQQPSKQMPSRCWRKNSEGRIQSLCQWRFLCQFPLSLQLLFRSTLQRKLPIPHHSFLSSSMLLLLPTQRPTPGLQKAVRDFFSNARYPTERSKIAYIISLLSGRALQWAETIWNTPGPVTTTAQRFMDQVKEVFSLMVIRPCRPDCTPFDREDSPLLSMPCSSEHWPQQADGTKWPSSQCSDKA
ncbi:hypothetical protein AALO_G00007900, partial [Alosa alosa]